MTDQERKRQAVAKRRATMANPFRQPRRRNQAARYLNPRQERMHRLAFDMGGNPTRSQT